MINAVCFSVQGLLELAFRCPIWEVQRSCVAPVNGIVVALSNGRPSPPWFSSFLSVDDLVGLLEQKNPACWVNVASDCKSVRGLDSGVKLASLQK